VQKSPKNPKSSKILKKSKKVQKFPENQNFFPFSDSNLRTPKCGVVNPSIIYLLLQNYLGAISCGEHINRSLLIKGTGNPGLHLSLLISFYLLFITVLLFLKHARENV